jgi:2-haloacid dehalogenase
MVVFDLGGVLINWNPRHLYRKIFGDDEAGMEAFLTNVCNMAWNERQDCGRLWTEAITEAIAQHPEHESNIRAYRERWPDMLADAIGGTVEILEELKDRGVRVLALTNWSSETFHFAEERFAFLQWFEGILVSGREGLMKPDPAIFQLLLKRYRLEPSSTVFIDDARGNVQAAINEGLRGIHFSTPDKLRHDLAALGLVRLRPKTSDNSSLPCA